MSDDAADAVECRELLPGGKVILLENVFTAAECAAVVERASAQGFAPATVKIQATTLKGENSRFSKQNSFTLSVTPADGAGDRATGSDGAASKSGNSTGAAAGAAADTASSSLPRASGSKGSTTIDTNAVVGDIRNNDSVVLKDAGTLVDELWKRVQPHLPENVRRADLLAGFGGAPVNPLQPDAVGDAATAVALGADKVRIYRYKLGQRFVRHYDGYEFGSVVYADNKKPNKNTGPQPTALLSLLLYLNDGTFAGGETNFFSTQGQKLLSVEPRCGSVLIYTQKLLHEGAPVRAVESLSAEPCKFVLRTDVMFVRDAEIDAYERHHEMVNTTGARSAESGFLEQVQAKAGCSLM